MDKQIEELQTEYHNDDIDSILHQVKQAVEPILEHYKLGQLPYRTSQYNSNGSYRVDRPRSRGTGVYRNVTNNDSPSQRSYDNSTTNANVATTSPYNQYQRSSNVQQQMYGLSPTTAATATRTT